MHTLYSMQGSGNCYKARLVMAQLDIPFQIRDIDILNGETHTPEFLAINPNAKVPTLKLDNGGVLTESNAMLLYLADGSPLLPSDRFEHAKVCEWLFWEQYSHEPAIAVARFWWSLAPGGRAEKADDFPLWHKKGKTALALMEQQLEKTPFLIGDRFTVADIALYAYTHVADEGGFDLAPYPNLRAWLDRVSSEPMHVPMDWRP
jgi:glutathione S-transferase